MQNLNKMVDDASISRSLINNASVMNPYSFRDLTLRDTILTNRNAALLLHFVKEIHTMI